MNLLHRMNGIVTWTRSAWKGPVPWLVVLGAAAAISLIQYGALLNEPFDYGDMSPSASDTSLLLGYLREGRTFARLAQPFGPTGYYRPMTYLWMAADYAVWGERPWGFRVGTLMVYLGSLALLGLLTARVAGSRAPGLVAILAFCLLGPHFLSLNWIWARGDVLCGAFYLAALLALMSARVPWIWAPLLTAGAIGAKEMAVTLPLLGSVWAALEFRRCGWRHVAALAGMWAALGGYLLVRSAVFGRVAPTQVGYDAPWAPFIHNYAAFLARPVLDLMQAPRVYLFSGWTLLYPGFWGFVLEQAVFWFSVALLLRRCPRAAAAFFLWKVIVYLPVLRYAVHLGRRSHYLYLPRMGDAMLLGLLCWQAWPLAEGLWRRVARGWSGVKRAPDSIRGA